MKKDNKTIGVMLRFWTDCLELKANGKVVTACWGSGVMKVEPNKTKGIVSIAPVPFNSLLDILPLLRELFRKQGIVIADSCRRPRIMNPKRKTW